MEKIENAKSAYIVASETYKGKTAEWVVKLLQCWTQTYHYNWAKELNVKTLKDGVVTFRRECYSIHVGLLSGNLTIVKGEVVDGEPVYTKLGIFHPYNQKRKIKEFLGHGYSIVNTLIMPQEKL